jgi:hypothetical protein
MMEESSPPGQAGPLSAGAAGTWFGLKRKAVCRENKRAET